MKESEKNNMNCDITFCNRECANKTCERNLEYKKDNIIKPYISVSNFDKCKEFMDKGKEKIYEY